MGNEKIAIERNEAKVELYKMVLFFLFMFTCINKKANKIIDEKFEINEKNKIELIEAESDKRP